jgi:hypothetical protein
MAFILSFSLVTASSLFILPVPNLARCKIWRTKLRQPHASGIEGFLLASLLYAVLCGVASLFIFACLVHRWFKAVPDRSPTLILLFILTTEPARCWALVSLPNLAATD